MQTSTRRLGLLWVTAGMLVLAGSLRAVQQPSNAGAPMFRAQEIAQDFGVGYAVASADVNGDGQTDILAISATDLVWFRAPEWRKEVILAAGATTADNVTLAPHDIDGDGRLDIALGAGWTRQNTGTLQWVRQNAPGSTPAWEVLPISAEPTLHRIRWADVDGDRKLELIVAPLHGKGAKGPEWDGPSARLLVFRPPANPRTDPWPMEVAGEQNHIQHNFLAFNLDGDQQDEIVTASKEGVHALKRRSDGTWTRTLIGEGAPGEVKLGRVGGRRLLATVEPWHGAGLAIYAERSGVWSKSTIETGLVEGHALGWADFDGDGDDELAVGWRGGGPKAGVAIYAVDREGALKTKTIVDDGGMAAEDLMVGDFNGDTLPDIVASGRATRNIKIYWNETRKKGEAPVAAAPQSAPPAAAGTKVVLLGTGTPQPNSDRSGPATAIVVNNTAYLVDFGPGVVRRASLAATSRGITALEATRLRVAFVTHLHSDHTVGYPDLIFTPWVIGRRVPLEVYGPKGLLDMTTHLLQAYKSDIDTRTNPEGNQRTFADGHKVNAHEIGAGVVYKDANVTVTAFPTAHAMESYGYRFETADRTIVISGDTNPTQATIDACRGCDVLIHEAHTSSWLAKRPEAGGAPPGTFRRFSEKYHTTTEQLADLARRAKPRLLILYHYNALSADELQADMMSRYAGHFVIGRDLDVY